MDEDNRNADPGSIKEGTDAVDAEDAEKVLKMKEKIQSKAGRGPLKRFAADVRLLCAAA